MDKQYLVKIYAQDGTTLKKVIPHDMLNSEPKFTAKMNGGQGEMLIDTKFPFDDFGEGTEIEFDFVITVDVTDDNNPNGITIYGGVIQEYEPYANAKQQGVKVKALGYAALLAYDYYKNGSSYSVSKSGIDPEQMFKDIIDHHRTVDSNSPINYTGSSTDTVGTNANITFTQKKHSDSIKEVQEVSPGFYWYVGADGVAKFKDKPTSATHTFIFGKHVTSFRAPKTAKQVVNNVYISYDGGNLEDDDSASITRFRKRTKIVDNQDVKDATTAQSKIDTELEKNDTELIKSEITINDSYDIESILPGQTCKIRNFNHASEFFSSNMQIVEVRYQGKQVVLSLEEHMFDIGEEIDNFVNG